MGDEHQLVDDAMIERAISVLTRFLETDPVGFNHLFAHLVRCSDNLFYDPTIQTDEDTYTVSVLGVVNGLFGVDDNLSGPIYFEYNDENVIVAVGRVGDD